MQSEQSEAGRNLRFRDEMLKEASAHLEVVASQPGNDGFSPYVDLMKAGRFSEAAPAFVSVASAYAAAPALSPAQKSQVYLNLAAVQLEAAPDAAKRSLQEAVALDDKSAKALALLAHFLVVHGEREAGERLARQAVAAAGEDAARWRAVAAADLGVLTHVRGDYAAAESHYRVASAGFDEAGDTAGVAEALGNLGLILRRQKKYAEAKPVFERALGIWRQMQRPEDTARTLGYLATLHVLGEQHAKAIVLFAERAKLSEALGDVAELAADHANLGNAYSKLGDKATACGHWRTAHTLYGRVGRAKEQAILAGLIKENGCAAVS